MEKGSSKTISPVAVFVTLYLVVIIFPFLWVLSASFKPTAEIFGEGAFRIISANPTLENYVNVLNNGLLRAMANSFIVACLTSIYVIIVASLAAYAITRFKFRGKNILLGIILAVSMFPQMIIVAPIYNLFMKLNWTNSYFVTLPYSTITLPVAVFILVTHFNKIPISLEEAATIDGATSIQILSKIVFRLAAPGIFTTAIIVFIAAWNEFLLTVTLNTNKSYHTVPVAISFLKTQFTILWGDVTAATVIATIPTLIIVLLFQKQIVSGLTSGAVKE